MLVQTCLWRPHQQYQCNKNEDTKTGPKTGGWLNVYPNPKNGTVLSNTEFTDAMCLQYGLEPPNLASVCDGCGARFTLSHALTCKHGRLIIRRHNEIRDTLGTLALQAFGKGAVRKEPLLSHPLHRETSTAVPIHTTPTRAARQSPHLRTLATSTFLHHQCAPNQSRRGLTPHHTNSENPHK